MLPFLAALINAFFAYQSILSPALVGYKVQYLAYYASVNITTMTLLNTLLYLVLPALGLLYLYVRRKYAFWSDRNVPCEMGQFPMGTFAGTGTKYHFTEPMNRVYRKFKRVASAAGMYMTVTPVLLVIDLELVKRILVKDFNSFRDRGIYYNEKDDPLSAHLLAIEGDKWRFLRNKLSPTFTSGKIKYMFLTVREIGDQFYRSFDKYVDSGNPVNIKVLAERFTSDVIGSCAFGLNCNSLKNEGSELLAMKDKVFGSGPFTFLKNVLVTSFREASRKLGVKMVPSDVSEYFMGIIRGTVEHRERNNEKRSDFLQLLMQLKNKGTVEDHEDMSSDRISMDEVAAQAFLFFFAGFETSSTTLAFALFELANNPAIQEKTRAEVQRVLAAHGGQVTYEALKDMTYLEQVINETLRLHPPLANLVRVANQPYQLTNPDVTLEKGQLLLIPVCSIHLDPEIYPNPSLFNPDRFTPEAIQARHTHAFLPFGDGPRNCIGMRFALLEVKFGVAMLLSKLKFTVSNRTQLPLELDVKSSLSDVKGGLWLDVAKL